ncbi:MAG TPA: transcriptional repressor [Candidatus Kapabacteria bacterium]|nr:transcriptional repressor [Candidatus Kapabacteria bacterium]
MSHPERHSSKQRDAILEAIRSFPGHPTADDVYASVRGVMPSISLGTVYRNLRLLVEDGAISEVPNPAGEAVQFDKMTAPHHHFICTECSVILDVAAMDVSPLATEVERQTGAKVQYNRLDFYGICPKCRAKAKQHK